MDNKDKENPNEDMEFEENFENEQNKKNRDIIDEDCNCSCKNCCLNYRDCCYFSYRVCILNL